MLAIGIGIAALGCGVGLGLIGYGAMTGMARQPEAISKLQIQMLIALAFVELVYLLTVFVVPGSFKSNGEPTPASSVSSSAPAGATTGQ